MVIYERGFEPRPTQTKFFELSPNCRHVSGFLFRQQPLKLPRFIHLFMMSEPPDEFALDIQLRYGRPVCVVLMPWRISGSARTLTVNSFSTPGLQHRTAALETALWVCPSCTARPMGRDLLSNEVLRAQVAS